MTSLVFLIWLIGILPQITSLLGGLCAIVLCFGIASFFIMMISSEYEASGKFFINHGGKWFGSLTAIIFVCATLKAIIPPQKTAWMMIGALAAQKIYESPKFQETSGNLLELINTKIKQETSEMKKEIETSSQPSQQSTS